jgi:hypothetical protein
VAVPGDGGIEVTPGCGHDRAGPRSEICRHLLDAPPDDVPDYHRCFTGTGFDQLVLCEACIGELDAGGRPDTQATCVGCADQLFAESGWVAGVRGAPEVRERPEAIDLTLARAVLPRLASLLVDLAHADAERRWYGLGADGTIVRFDGWEATEPVARLAVLPEPGRASNVFPAPRPRLHVAGSGRFAAVANDHGRYGSVVDLGTGRETMRLDGGGYYEHTVPFSLAFAQFEGREVLVHRTSWCGLDVSDPASGELLTPRSSETSADRTPRRRRLGYFRGRLAVSPGGRWVADDAWVWSPVGIIWVGDLRRWLSADVWEPDDGPTLRPITHRPYYWDHGMCWIDERRLAIEGIGEDDEHMVPGALVVDVTAPGNLPASWPRPDPPDGVSQVAGPAGRLFSDGIRLFSSAEDGLSIWSLGDGARVAHVPGFVPQHHGRSSGVLVELRDGEVLAWSHRPGA